MDLNPFLWGYNDYNETAAELKQRLIDTTWEVQTIQTNAREEIKKKDDQIQTLLHLLHVTSRERDEAREQLNLLLHKLHSRANSTITESDTISVTRNNNVSYVSSPDSEISHIDRALTRLNQIVSEGALPEKGKLLDAVMRVGPMLQSLMIAGPLPQWKNPPLLQQNKILPVPVKALNNSQTLNQTTTMSSNPLQRELIHDIL